MIIDLYLMLQLFMIAFFLIAYFTHQEVLWGLSAFLNLVGVFNSNYVQMMAADGIMHYVNATSFGLVNAVLFLVAFFFGALDFFDKHGTAITASTKAK